MTRFTWTLKVALHSLWVKAIVVCYSPVAYRNFWVIIFSSFLGETSNVRLRGGGKFRIRKGTSDRAMMNEMFIFKPYTSHPAYQLRRHHIVIDVGANVGAFTVFCARQVELGHVYAMEPSSGNYDQLKVNVELNKLSNVTLSRKGASGGEESGVLFGKGATASLCWPDSDSSSETVQLASLRSFMSEHGIEKVDLLKMDCEGGEFAALMTPNAIDLSRVERICVEYHNISEEMTGECLSQFLIENGFKVDNCGNSWNGLILARRV